MLERIQNVLKSRKHDDKGFSLVELAVVIVIIGILVAIAVPIFSNMQQSAQRAAIESAAANGAATVASNIAAGNAADLNVASLGTDGITVSVTGTTIDSYCVSASKGTDTAKKGTATTCTPATSWDTTPAPTQQQ